MKKTISTVALLTSLITLVFGASLVSGALNFMVTEPILIESLESRTLEQKPVFNKIRYFPGKAQDVWMMNQSHYGLGAETKKWERLAIIVDKTQEPMRARYLQIEPGPLDGNPQAKRVNYRVSCYLCHSNGPRAIRPNLDSTEIDLSLKQRAQIQLLNLRIKTYGKILPADEHAEEDRTLETPFRFAGKLENDTLEVQSCSKCHQNEGFLARGKLTRQHAMTIQFMLDSGEMPPPGFSVSDEDLAQINAFLLGF